LLVVGLVELVRSGVKRKVVQVKNTEREMTHKSCGVKPLEDRKAHNSPTVLGTV